MAILNFNADEVAPSTSLDPIPAGKYQAVITDSELKMTKSGTGSYLELTFEIISGEYEKRKLWARLNIRNNNQKAVEIAQRDLSAICHAVNVLHPQDSCELHDKPLTIAVRLVKNENDDEYRNEIKGYGPAETVPPAKPDKPAASAKPKADSSVPPWAKK